MENTLIWQLTSLMVLTLEFGLLLIHIPQIIMCLLISSRMHIPKLSKKNSNVDIILDPFPSEKSKISLAPFICRPSHLSQNLENLENSELYIIFHILITQSQHLPSTPPSRPITTHAPGEPLPLFPCSYHISSWVLKLLFMMWRRCIRPFLHNPINGHVWLYVSKEKINLRSTWTITLVLQQLEACMETLLMLEQTSSELMEWVSGDALTSSLCGIVRRLPYLDLILSQTPVSSLIPTYRPMILIWCSIAFSDLLSGLFTYVNSYHRHR